MKTGQNYNLSADIIRIFATFFVVFSHTTDVFVLWTPFKGGSAWWMVYYLNTLSRVAVPLFVILSGYLILDSKKTNNLKDFYKRRFSRMLLPFIFWLIVYFWWTVYWGKHSLTVPYVIDTLWTANIWHLYFLIIILELYLLAPVLVRFKNLLSSGKQTLLFWVFALFSISWAALANIPTYHFDLAKYSLTIFIPYIAYFYAGAFLKHVRVKKLQAIIYACGYFFFAFVTNLLARGNMSHFIVFNYSPTLFIMSICFFLALKNIHEHFPKFFSSRLFHGVPFIAGTTFGIYLLHFLVLDVVRDRFHLEPWQMRSPLVLFAVLPAIITFTICLLVVLLGRKIPYVRYIFG